MTHICKSEEDNTIWVSANVVLRVYNMVKTQRRYFSTRSKRDLAECKAREAGFMDWVEKQLLPLLPDIER